jgi:large subunit ribosomal protein L25
MITETVVEATPREEKGKNASRRLRANGQIPAAVYGGGMESVPVAINARELGTILRSDAGRNTIFTLNIQGHDSSPVMIKNLDVNPVTNKLVHTDLVRISLTEKTQVSVRIEFVGEPAGVKLSGGMIDVHLHEVEIECLPRDIPEQISVDVSNMELGDHIRVSDIPVDSDAITLVSDPDLLVVSLLAPSAVVEEVVEAPADAAAPTEAAPEA